MPVLPINGNTAKTIKMIAAKTKNTDDQFITESSALATGGPTICPAEPAAVAMPNARERCSAAVARPTTAKITPKPVPATPKPTRIS